MADLEKVTQLSVKMKDLQIFNNQIINSDGEIVDLISILYKAYGDMSFDMATSLKQKEVIPLESDILD